MMITNCVRDSKCHIPSEPVQKKTCFRHYIPVSILLFICFIVGSPYILNYTRIPSEYEVGRVVLNQKTNLCEKIPSKYEVGRVVLNKKSNSCESHGKPLGSEALPQGIISKTSNLEMQPIGYLSRSSNIKGKAKSSKSLLAIAIGIKQKKVVNEIVKKFHASRFTVMLFHYDGVVDEWNDLEWSDSVLHVSAFNQTKWWFAKRFLHPDIVNEYNYIFLWDEDLGVDNFHPERYLSIIKKEGLEISQPALDVSKSQVHYQITARLRKGNVHRRTYKFSGGGRCYENSTAPPCTGKHAFHQGSANPMESSLLVVQTDCPLLRWVEMMAPVFSRDAWRCVWHMIQNDLIHAWGLDTKLGYCTQGDRTKTVGVVDSEYIIHKGIPSLGSAITSSRETTTHNSLPAASDSRIPVRSAPDASNARLAIRRRSYAELETFRRRWRDAAAADACWVDPYPSMSNSTNPMA